MRGLIDFFGRAGSQFEANVVLLLIWAGLFFLCGLAAFAIDDYQQRSQEQLERVHAAGMAIGATMCGRYEQ